MRILVACLFAAGCLPRPEPAQPQQQYAPPPAYAQPQAQTQPQPTATAQGGVTVAATDPNAPQQTTATAQGGVTIAPSSPQQPPPLPPTLGTQQAQAPYYPQPYGQPYPPPQYPAPQAYPPPPAYPAPTIEAQSSTRLHDGEVIADFAVVGTFAALDILSRQNIDNGNAVGFILVAGMVGGGGIGYVLTNKYEVDAGAAHATTLGLTLGFANGALLIQPSGWTETSSVLNLLFVGSAVGATGGFVYGQKAKLTSGQAMFVANMALLGTATAALGAITGSRDGEFGTWENTSLALGLDGGTVAGAVIAPSLNWSAKRAKVVFAATAIGALAGGMFAGLLTNNEGESRTEDGDVVAGAMTAGLWGGFGLGVLMTKQYNPDPRFEQPSSAPPRTASKSATPSTILPWVGVGGQLGVMTGGSF
jgi:hypothetical protein